MVRVVTHCTKRERFVPSFIIEADRLVKFYGKAKEPALDELGLKVPEGKIFTLLGRNGAGKTTFLRIATTQEARANVKGAWLALPSFTVAFLLLALFKAK